MTNELDAWRNWSVRKTQCALALLALATADCSAKDADFEVAAQREALCKPTSLATNPNGHASIGTLVELTATSPTCDSGETPEFSFRYRRVGGPPGYDTLGPYAASPTATLDTTGLESGKYLVNVLSRSAGSTANYEGIKAATLFIGDTCPQVALAVTPTAPRQPGTVLQLEAAATCYGKPPEYRFLVRPPGGTYSEIQGWGTANATWDTTGTSAGPHTLRVEARAVDNASYDSLRVLAYTIGETCTSVAATQTPASPVTAGTQVAVQAAANCSGNATADFQFRYRLKGERSWTTIRSWGGPAITWDTSGLAGGVYQLLTEARSSDYPGKTQTRRVSNFVIGDLCSSVQLFEPVPAAPQWPGTVLTLAAEATCANTTPEYRFQYRGPLDSGFLPIAEWTPSPSMAFDTTGLPSGAYTLKVEAKAAGSSNAQVARARVYGLGEACVQVTALVTTPVSPQPAETPVSLAAEAECYFSATPEFAFAIQPAGGRWTSFRDWGGPTATLAGLGLAEGPHKIRVSVRAAGHAGPAEAVRYYSYTFGPPCPSGYTGDGAGGCTDIDECQVDNGGCDALTMCTNTPGARSCGACPTGYAGDGESGCVEIDECVPNPCENGGTCTDGIGTYTCQCPPAYGGANCEVAPVHLLAAGDIGDCTRTTDTATGNLLDLLPGTIAVLGDIAYPNGATTDFANCFDPPWGRHKSRMAPVPGNHEYGTAGAAPYYAYFGSAAGESGEGYYSYDLGAWHIVALNSNCSQVSCSAGSAQEAWLRADLAASAASCTLAYFHHPRFSSGQHGHTSSVSPLYAALVDYGAELVLSGHDHDYERWLPQNDTGTATPTGVVQFVVGTGGTSLRSFVGGKPANSVVRDASVHGILDLTLKAHGYSWEFVPITAGAFTDTGTASCH